MSKNGYSFGQRRLVNQDEAAIVERPSVPRARFMNNWTRKTAFNASYLVPFMVDECLPGDHLSYNVTAYLRLSTPLFPMLDNQRIHTFFFFVPCRLVWENWAKFMGEQKDPGSSIAFTVPRVVTTTGGDPIGSLLDHMGVPGIVGLVHAASNMDLNALPFRAYNLIYNEWFRDENLINSAVVDVDDGPDAIADYQLRKRAKAHDYFTSALPWAQKFTAPTIPIGGLAPVTGIGKVNQVANIGAFNPAYETQGAANYPSYQYMGSDSINDQKFVVKMTGDGADELPLIYADLAATSGVPINTLRQAFMVQTLLERDARGGTRYVELIWEHFGVRNPDYRLQRPEYIGGGVSPLQITPIAQTAPDAGGDGLGALGAAGTSVGQHRASYAATEHGYVIGLINVRSEVSYQRALHKMWSRSTRYDFYIPSLAQLGEQAILKQEIYYRGEASDSTVFGYQERWHEYRTRTSEVTGIMRSGLTGTLDMWHLAQHFTSVPSLNQTFIEDDGVNILDRVLAAGANARTVGGGMQYLADIAIDRSASRPIPAFGTPANLGRF